jgi:hypothetical protein
MLKIEDEMNKYEKEMAEKMRLARQILGKCKFLLTLIGHSLGYLFLIIRN